MAASTSEAPSAPAVVLTASQERFVLIVLFVIVTAAKVLLFPAYRSTDFDVHRHWKAVTRHLPPKEWYFDDRHVSTVHTLDYPPGFAWFEWLLSHLPLSQTFLGEDRCLELLDDADNAPSERCVAYMRSTVLFSDLILWIAAYRLASLMRQRYTVFLLIVAHPGLLWLDHVHFQYNGLLLGLLLWSVSCLIQGMDERIPSRVHLQAAVLFALLLTMKHLYLTLSLWYAAYLFRRYCIIGDRFVWSHFVSLALVTVTVLVMPASPILWTDPQAQLTQILARLFPFGRGLVHDYWAGNLWAVYMAGAKVLTLLVCADWLPKEDPSPALAAGLLLVLLSVGAWHAWKAAAEPSAWRLIVSFVYSAMASFMVGYHVHEKAILTALLPMLLLPLLLPSSKSSTAIRLLVWEAHAWGLLSLFPLLFQPQELLLKLTSYTAYMAMLYHVLLDGIDLSKWTRTWLLLTMLAMASVMVVLEVLPMSVWGRYEFVPLAVTSLACAGGLMQVFGRLTYFLLTL